MENEKAPLWDAKSLILDGIDKRYLIASWVGKLKVFRKSKGGELTEIDLYDDFGMSLQSCATHHPGVKRWMNTLPSEVIKLCGRYPHRQFYLTRIMAHDQAVFSVASRSFILFLCWVEEARHKKVPHESLFRVIEGGESGMIRALGLVDTENVLRIFNKMPDDIAYSVPPEFITRCFANQSRYRFLKKLPVVKRWHFEFLSLYSAFLDTGVSALMIDGAHDYERLDNALGIAGLGKRARVTAKRILRNPTEKEWLSLSKIRSRDELTARLIKLGATEERP